MFTTLVLAFREFLEAFLIIGVFLGVSKKLKLNKEKEILLAAVVGILFSLLLPAGIFILGDQAKNILTEHNADTLEGYLLIFSGIFIAYIIFSLHKFIKNTKRSAIEHAKDKMLGKQLFDITLFLTIIFFVAREGFEIALLTATTSLFSAFSENMTGLLIGCITAAAVGALTFVSFLKLSVQKVFLYTEYAIILFGAAMVKNGIGILLENYLDFHIAKVLPLPLQFLPDGETTIVGHLLRNLLGIDKNLSILGLTIMGIYILSIYLLFFHNKVK